MDGRTRTELAPRAGCPVGAALRERARGGRHGADPRGGRSVGESQTAGEKKREGETVARDGVHAVDQKHEDENANGGLQKRGACLPESGDEHSAQELQCPDLSFRVKTKTPRRGRCHHGGGHRQDGGPGRRAASPPGPTWGPREPVGQACGHVRTAQPSSPEASRVRGHEHASSDPHSHPCRAPPSPDSALGVGTQGCLPSATVVALLVTGEDEIWTTEVRSRRPA